MTKVKIREIKQGDATELCELYPHWGMKRCKRRIKQSQSSESQYRLGAVAGEELVGHICVKLGKMHHHHIARFYSLIVHPEHREKGIATLLLDEAIELLLDRIEMLLLQVQHDNKPAQKLFQKLGFKKYGYLPNAFKRNGEYKDNVLMCKEL